MSAKKVRAEEKKAPGKVNGERDSGRNRGQPPPSPAATELQQSGGVELRGSVRRLLPGHLSELLLFLREPERLLSLRCLVSAGAAQTAGRSVAAARSASPRPAPARRSAAKPRRLKEKRYKEKRRHGLGGAARDENDENGEAKLLPLPLLRRWVPRGGGPGRGDQRVGSGAQRSPAARLQPSEGPQVKGAWSFSRRPEAWLKFLLFGVGFAFQLARSRT